MRKITVTGNETIRIGRVGENRAVQIIWPDLLEKWRELYGDGTVQLAARRPKDTAPYPVVCEIRENDVMWTVQESDTAQYGIGECELTYLVGEVVAKSQTWATEIFRGLTYEETIEPPDDPAKTWFTEIRKEIGNLGDLKTDEKSNLVEAINEVSQSSEGIGISDHTKLKNRDAKDQHPMSAITGLEMTLKGKQPVGTYLTHDDLQSVTDAVLTQAKESGEFDGAAGQDGITPTIGDNGNWYLGDTDTGKSSRGETGPAGADGRDGTDGQPGTDGKSAYQYAQDGGYTGTEAEFAAKLAAEKFVNPNALTFTGAVTGRYDGSAAVSVEIPSGGGADYEFSGEILAYGTCVAGSSELVDTGVTLADLRRYRMFLTSVAGVSNVSLHNWYTKIGLLSIGRVNNKRAQSILWEFLNADKTLIMARIGADGNHPVINRFNGAGDSYGVINAASMPDCVVDLSGFDESTPIITYPTNASIDVNWCILGVLK